MGSEASRPVQPPEDWKGQGEHADDDGYEFQIISPTSDISNPSDIRKLHQTSTRDRRRASRVAARTIPSNRRTSIPEDEKNIPAPSAFYFPNETERTHRSGGRICTVERDLVAAAKRRASLGAPPLEEKNTKSGTGKKGGNPLRKLSGCFGKDGKHVNDGKTARKGNEKIRDREKVAQQAIKDDQKRKVETIKADPLKQKYNGPILDKENRGNLPPKPATKKTTVKKTPIDPSVRSRKVMVPKQSPPRRPMPSRGSAQANKLSPQRRMRHNQKQVVKEQQQAFRKKRIAAANQSKTSTPDAPSARPVFRSNNENFLGSSPVILDAGARIPALLPTLSEEPTLASSEEMSNASRRESVEHKKTDDDQDSFGPSAMSGFSGSDCSPEILAETKNEELAIIFTTIKPEAPVELSEPDILTDFPGANIDIIKSVGLKSSSAYEEFEPAESEPEEIALFGKDTALEDSLSKIDEEPVELTRNEAPSADRPHVEEQQENNIPQDISFHSPERSEDDADIGSALSIESSISEIDNRNSVGSSTIAALRTYRIKTNAKKNFGDDLLQEVSDEDDLDEVSPEQPPRIEILSPIPDRSSVESTDDAIPSDDRSACSGHSGSLENRMVAVVGDDEISTAESYFKPEEEVHKQLGLPKAVNIPEKPILQVASLARSSNVEPESPADCDAKNKKSKLEKLYRPALLALMSDDTRSLASYDPYEIKVTESAPSVIESKDYRAIALSANSSPAGCSAHSAPNPTDLLSPSVLSIDSHTPASPFLNAQMVSNQAMDNATFLFSQKYCGMEDTIQAQPMSRRDSATFSISTFGSRSRLSRRTARSKAITIPIRRESYGSSADTKALSVESSSRSSSGSSRRVRFENILGALPAPKVELPSAEMPPPELPPANTQAKTSIGSATVSSFASICVPAIESKVSDLTDTMNDFGTFQDDLRGDPTYSPIPEEDDPLESSQVLFEANSPVSSKHGSQVRWTYKEDANGFNCVATPFLKDRNQGVSKANHPTESPFLRFKAAKNKFAVAKRGGSPASSKSKEKEAVKVKRKVSSGLVSNRIDELNKRVTGNRFLSPRKPSQNSRLSSEASSFMRTVAMDSPNAHDKTKYKGIFAITDDEVTVSTHDNSLSSHDGQSTVRRSDAGSSSIGSPLNGENHVGDERSSDGSRSASVATVRKDDSLSYSQGTSRFSRDSTFQGRGNPLFRDQSLLSLSSHSYSRHSTHSEGESTTLSAIMGKENAVLPFRAGANAVKPAEQPQYTATNPEDLCLSPTQRTPMQARKWRSLAAAAKQKDMGRTRKVLSQKSANFQ